MYLIKAYCSKINKIKVINLLPFLMLLYVKYHEIKKIFMKKIVYVQHDPDSTSNIWQRSL